MSDILEQIQELSDKFSNLFEVEGLGDPSGDVPPSTNKIKRDIKTKDGKVELVSVENELFPYEGDKKEQYRKKVLDIINGMIQGTKTLEDLMQFVRQKKNPLKEAVEILESIINEKYVFPKKAVEDGNKKYLEADKKNNEATRLARKGFEKLNKKIKELEGKGIDTDVDIEPGVTYGNGPKKEYQQALRTADALHNAQREADREETKARNNQRKLRAEGLKGVVMRQFDYVPTKKGDSFNVKKVLDKNEALKEAVEILESLKDQIEKKVNKREISLDKANELEKKIEDKMSPEKNAQEYFDELSKRHKKDNINLDFKAIAKKIRERGLTGKDLDKRPLKEAVEIMEDLYTTIKRVHGEPKYEGSDSHAANKSAELLKKMDDAKGKEYSQEKEKNSVLNLYDKRFMTKNKSGEIKTKTRSSRYRNFADDWRLPKTDDEKVEASIERHEKKEQKKNPLKEAIDLMEDIHAMIDKHGDKIGPKSELHDLVNTLQRSAAIQYGEEKGKPIGRRWQDEQDFADRRKGEDTKNYKGQRKTTEKQFKGFGTVTVGGAEPSELEKKIRREHAKKDGKPVQDYPFDDIEDYTRDGSKPQKIIDKSIARHNKKVQKMNKSEALEEAIKILEAFISEDKAEALNKLSVEFDKEAEGIPNRSKEMYDLKNKFHKLKKKVEKHYNKSEALEEALSILEGLFIADGRGDLFDDLTGAKGATGLERIKNTVAALVKANKKVNKKANKKANKEKK